MLVETVIEEKLLRAFAPARLQVIDQSADHVGHAGARPEGETHFRVLIVSDMFDGMAMVARQRLVYQTLAEEMAGPVHALAMKTMSCAEDSEL